MPTYDYRCAKGHEVEQSRAIADRDVEEVCPKCAEEDWRTSVMLERVLAAPGFALRGIGWHNVHYNKYGRKKHM